MPGDLQEGRQDKLRVEFSDVSVTYGRGTSSVEALRAATFAVESGRVVALVGPSGCGKSTALRVAAGLQQQSSGTVRAEFSRNPAGFGGLSMMFQTPSLFDWRNVMANVTLPLEQRKSIRKAARRERALELLEAVGLADFADRLPFELSGGMQQRVALARALVTQPDLILLDEPFGALDAITRDRMCIMLDRLVTSQHLTVLLVTHSISEAILLSDRIVVMSERPGHVVAEFSVPLRHPRSLASRLSAESKELERKMLALLEGESGELQSQSGEPNGSI